MDLLHNLAYGQNQAMEQFPGQKTVESPSTKLLVQTAEESVYLAA